MAKEFFINVTPIINKEKAFNSISKDLKALSDKFDRKGAKRTTTDSRFSKQEKKSFAVQDKVAQQRLKLEQKNFKFSNKVDKYRLSETKKLIKRGMSFEDARKQALKRSILDEKDRRKFQWEELKEDSKDKNFRRNFFDRLKDSVFKGSFFGSGIGSMIGNVASKFANGFISFAINAMGKKAEEDKQKRYLAMSLSFDEIKAIKAKLDSVLGYADEKKQLDFIETVTGFKGTIARVGINDPTLFMKLVDQVKDLVDKGAVKDHATAFDAINTALETGVFDKLAALARNMPGYYNAFSTTFDETNRESQYHKFVDPERREVNIERLVNFMRSRSEVANKEFGGQYKASASMQDDITNTIETIETSIADMASILLPAIQDAFEWVSMFVVDPVGTVGTLLKALGGQIMMYWELAKYHIGEFFAETMHDIKEKIPLPGWRTGKPYVRKPPPESIDKYGMDALKAKFEQHDKAMQKAREARDKKTAFGNVCRDCKMKHPHDWAGQCVEKCYGKS